MKSKKTWVYASISILLIITSVIIFAQKDNTDALKKQIKTLTNIDNIINEDRVQLWIKTSQ
ncbi:MAG: KxYKxGKxW signal peptide domain-containing protein [Bacteroidales bacterium]|nr:KxYKxGKxW signal peptide domain-containing protein [Bacteroidales bacterium]